MGMEEFWEELKEDYLEMLDNIIDYLENAKESCEKTDYKINKEKLDGTKQDIENILEYLYEQKEEI